MKKISITHLDISKVTYNQFILVDTGTPLEYIFLMLGNKSDPVSLVEQVYAERVCMDASHVLLVTLKELEHGQFRTQWYGVSIPKPNFNFQWAKTSYQVLKLVQNSCSHLCSIDLSAAATHARAFTLFFLCHHGTL